MHIIQNYKFQSGFRWILIKKVEFLVNVHFETLIGKIIDLETR